jgi:HEAT repeat protein
VATVEPFYKSPDAGIRKVVVYALGALPGHAQLPTLRDALRDPEADVRWNAAVALARHGSADGVGVIGQMLDRSYLEQTVRRDIRRDVQPDTEVDPVAEVIISGLRAVAALRDTSLKPSIEALSQQDRNMKVRQAAMEALRAIG